LNSRKPFAKEIMRVCENHARLIADDDANIRVTALSWEKLSFL